MSNRQPQPKPDGIKKPNPPPAPPNVRSGWHFGNKGEWVFAEAAPPKKEFTLEEFPSADVTFALSDTRCHRDSPDRVCKDTPPEPVHYRPKTKEVNYE